MSTARAIGNIDNQIDILAPDYLKFPYPTFQRLLAEFPIFLDRNSGFYWQLAKIEAKSAFRTLLAECPELRFREEDLSWRGDSRFRGIKSLRLEF